MNKRYMPILFAALLGGVSLCYAESPRIAVAQTAGAVIVLPATAEVRRPNDQAHLTFNAEEQDKDKAQAASRLNQKIRRGLEILKQQDPSAVLQTRGYYTYPVYQENPVPATRPPAQARPIVGWRVGQSVDVTTLRLNILPQTVAAAQQVLGLNGLNFGLSTQAQKKADEERIALTIANLNERIIYVARAMGKSQGDAIIDTVDFEGSGAFASQNDAMAPKMMMRVAGAAEASPIVEPSFEPGESVLSMRLVGRVRFR